MTFYYQSFLTMSSAISGVIIAITAENTFGIWFGLELNMISFICYVMLNQHRSTMAEVMLKYFLIQAPASSIFIFAMLMSHHQLTTNTLVILAMSLKSGIAPLHSWFPQISESLNWNQLLVLLSLQKIAPLSIISSTFNTKSLMTLYTLTVLSAIIGALGGMNETSIHKILAYSSIAHTAWMLTAIMIFPSLWIIYFSVYLIILMSIVPTLNYFQIHQLPYIFTSKIKITMTPFLLIPLLSLMGLPPLLGFIPKLMVISMSFLKNLLIILPIIVLSSIITLYYYLRIFMSISFIKSPTQFILHSSIKYLPSPLYFSIFTNLSGSVFMPLIMLLHF